VNRGKIEKLGVSDSEIKNIRVLAESVRDVSGAKTADDMAGLSDAMFEIFISTTKEGDRTRAIRRIWELEEWFTKKS
jgi:hypothetical protein